MPFSLNLCYTTGLLLNSSEMYDFEVVKLIMKQK
jgi:hypothetical protein